MKAEQITKAYEAAKAQYATLGYGTLLGPGMLASNISQAGACFAVALRTKDKEMKSTALSSATTALFGITEPSKYFFKVATPELIQRSVGSSTGTNDALGSII